MNFLEAYEANKTKRVRLKQCPSFPKWYHVGQLRKHGYGFSPEDIEGQWEVEIIPRTIWINEYGYSYSDRSNGWVVHSSKESAEQYNINKIRMSKWIEVIE